MTSTKTSNRETPTQTDDAADVRDDDMVKRAVQRKGEVRLAREVQARIGLQLRSMYDDVVNEGVPPHIAELVRRLSGPDDGTP